MKLVNILRKKTFYIYMILVLVIQFQASGLSDAEIDVIIDGFNGRVSSTFDEITTSTFTPGNMRTYEGKIQSRAWTCSMASYSLVNLYQDTNLAEANQKIEDICIYYADHPEDTSYEYDSNAWAGSLFVRIIKLFGSNGQYQGRLDIDVEDQLLELMWDWANVHSDISITQYDQSSEWRIEDSENHDAQRFMPCWGFAMIFKDHPDFKDRTYTHGGTALEHYNAWTGYFKEYLAERAKRGLFVEVASNIYSIATIKGIYDFYDYSEDKVLKKRAERILNLFWTVWAQEQLDGVRGGGKARLQQGTISEYNDHDYIRELGWYYFNTGRWASTYYSNFTNWDNINVPYTGFMCAATSSYRPSGIVGRIVLDPALDVYEVKQRIMGLAMPDYNLAPDYRLPTNSGGILRYCYRTPEFIIGTSMLDALPNDNWVNISSQDRWSGVIFAGHPQSRIFPQCKSTAANLRTYNQSWSVQKQGTLITQKLSTSVSAGDMRVYFSRRGLTNRVEEDSWIFVEVMIDDTSEIIAYAAVRPVDGGYVWDGDIDPVDGLRRWVKCNNQYSPVIIQVAGKNEYSSYSGFKSAVKSLSLNYSNSVLQFTGLSGDSFTFYADYSNLPKTNDQTIDIYPGAVYESPFIQGTWGNGIITINDGNDETELDFVETDGCGIYGFLVSDLNQDCKIDISDFSILAGQWLDCTMFPLPECGVY